MKDLGVSAIPECLESAWLSRWNQRIEASMGELADVQTSAGWKELNPETLASLSRKERLVYTEALLLRASLLRAQGQRQKSSAFLQKILSRVDALGEPRGFRLLFEFGLDHWIDHDVANALEYFLLAERKARNSEERLFSLSNILWCLEALDLERAEVERKIKNLFNEIGPSAKISHVVEQWQAYTLRKSFYTKMEISLTNEKDCQGQASFFSKWVRSLPYMGCANSSLSLTQDYIWQEGYRIRTLAGIWIPSDRLNVRVGDAIDRLYLWTWFWMAKRPEVTQEKLLYTLESVLQEFDIENEGKENLLLLRNSLEWILLLEPSFSARLHRFLRSLRRVQSAYYPVLEAEYLLIQRLSIQGHSSDLDRRIGKFPIFSKILREAKGAEPANLAPLIHERLVPFLNLQADDSYTLIVDCLRKEVRIPKQEQVFHSPRLVKLLAALAKEERVSLEELFFPEADLRSGYNLVARARKLIGEKSILLRKREAIRGPEWPRVLVLHSPGLSAVEKIPSVVRHTRRIKFVDSEAHFQAARALLPVGFDRLSLEKKLRISKATACRMIETWLKERKVSRVGRAKATTYSWKY